MIINEVSLKPLTRKFLKGAPLYNKQSKKIEVERFSIPDT